MFTSLTKLCLPFFLRSEAQTLFCPSLLQYSSKAPDDQTRQGMENDRLGEHFLARETECQK